MSCQRRLEKELEKLGYVWDRKNSKNVEFWVHEDTGVEIKVPSGVSDSQAQAIIKDARRALRMSTKDNKRNPAQIKRRDAEERDRIAADVARREAAIPALRAAGDWIAVDEAMRLIEAERRRLLYLDRMMREIPLGA